MWFILILWTTKRIVWNLSHRDTWTLSRTHKTYFEFIREEKLSSGRRVYILLQFRFSPQLCISEVCAATAVGFPNLRYVSCTVWLSWENFELHWSAFFHPITYPSCLTVSTSYHASRHSVRTGRRQNYSALTWPPINELCPSPDLVLELFNKCVGRNFLYQIILPHEPLICDIQLSRNVEGLPQTLNKVNLTLYAPCIISQYVYEPTKCTKFSWIGFIFN